MDNATENSSDGEVMFSGPSRSNYAVVVVDSEFPRQIQNHHFHPSHPLFLVKRKGFPPNLCNSCEKVCYQGIFYRCDLCDFDLDTNCAKLSPPTIKYLGHPDHLLSLFDYFSASSHRCKACQKYCNGQVYVLRCVPCNFYVHVTCLPHKVKHKNHGHFFTLATSVKEEERGVNELVCYECDAKINPDEPVYYCGKCNYPLHIACFSEAIAVHHENGRVLVGADEAMVKLMISDEEVMFTGPNRSEVMFTDPNRSDYLVVVDSKFPRQIQSHPFHPFHPLFLVKRYFPRITCNSCSRYCERIFYRCDLCDFDLDTNCAKLIPTIKYLGHPDHLLSLFHIDYSTFRYRCNVCVKECRGHVLRCVPCNFNFHVDCLPHKVKHKNHRHFFTLTTSIKEEDRGINELVCFECDAKINPDKPVYYCAKCCYPLHIGCSSEAIADHHENGHVLVGEDELEARLRILERETPHKTSTKFPLKIKHPFHSQHPLTLTIGKIDVFQFYQCSVCRRLNYGFRYHCSNCDFFLDLNCVLRKPAIKYDGHQEHLLIFLKKVYGDRIKCGACYQNCDTSPILRCVDCNFNLHIDCFPALPRTFKNPQGHLHTLTLTDSFAGDLSEDEFYCDFCEDERDPKRLVYFCEECPFVAHVTCVLHEELPSILAELDGTKRDDGVVEESVFVDVSNDKIEDEVEDENLTQAKIDAEMRKLQLKLEELQKKRALPRVL